MTIAHGQAYFRLISFSGTISYLVFHQKFHFFTLRIQRTSSVLLPYFGQSYEFLGAHRASSNPVASKDVWYAIHSPTFLLPLFFPIPCVCSFLFSLVGPLLLPRLHIIPRKMLQQESSGGAVRKCFEPFCAYTLQPRTQFQFATAAPLQPSQLLSGVLELYHLLYLSPSPSSHPAPPPPSFYSKGRRCLYFSNLESKNGRVLCNHPILIQYRHFTSELFKSTERRSERLLGGTYVNSLFVEVQEILPAARVEPRVRCCYNKTCSTS